MFDRSQSCRLLLEHWKKQAILVGPPATPLEIESFEAKYSVRMPASLREYFLTVNGMRTLDDKYDTDEELFHFLTLQDIEEEEQKDPSPRNRDGSRLIVLVEMCIWAEAWGIRLGQEQDVGGEVYVYGPNKPVEIASSFPEFLEKYIQGGEAKLTVKHRRWWEFWK